VHVVDRYAAARLRSSASHGAECTFDTVSRTPARALARRIAVQVAIAHHVARKLAPPLVMVVAYTVVAALVVRWDLARDGARLPDFGATAYALYTQLFFEPTDPLPSTLVARIVFWITPAIGAILIAQGLLKIGAGLLDLATRRELWVRIVSEQMRKHVVVCGLGHVGTRVVDELVALGEEIVAIERSPDAPGIEPLRARGVPVHVGDARRDELLSATGIAHAKAVVCATDDDLANLEIALDAKRMNPGVRVVMRMFDQRLAAKVGGALELDASFSTSAVAAPLIALQATERGVLGAYRIGASVRVTAEAIVGARADGRAIADLEAGARFRVVGRLVEGEPKAIEDGDVARTGDRLIVDVDAKDLHAARDTIEAAHDRTPGA
jgi:voltage-gated potassium channel Kch